MDELIKKIQGLEGPQVAEAVKNLRIALQYEWQLEIIDEEARQALQEIKTFGETEELRQAIISGIYDADKMERWGKSVLLYVAADPKLRNKVDESIDDAMVSSIKDFGLSSLIVLGTVLVLLKWRPHKVTYKKGEWEIKWKENDVSAVSSLAKLVSPLRIRDARIKKYG